MKIAIKATNMDLTPSIKDYVEDKIGGLDKFVDPIETKVEVARDRKHRSGMVFRAEVNMVMSGKLIRADAEGEDIYAAIDIVVPKLKEQISKFKDKRSTLQKRGARSAKRKN